MTFTRQESLNAENLLPSAHSIATFDSRKRDKVLSGTIIEFFEAMASAAAVGFVSHGSSLDS
jgi:hypothetical protein